jgi:heme/copper-type cytochrome/quinol oxidase subunit 3
MAGNGPQVKGGDGMRALEVLAAQGLAIFALLIFASLLLAYAAGVAIGRWHQARSEETVEATSFVTNGLLGLLAFTLGLTIAMAQGRFETRRGTSLAETNAIGTAWLRASAFDHPRAAEIARLLEEYTRLRLAFVEAPMQRVEVERLSAEANRMQGVIWGHATALTRERADPLTAALQASLNDVFDQGAAQRWAFAAPIPSELMLFLMGMAVLTIGTIGYQFGLKRVGNSVLAVLLVAVWTGAMVVVVDLATARFGAVRPDSAPYLWTIQGFRGGVVIPPPP